MYFIRFNRENTADRAKSNNIEECTSAEWALLTGGATENDAIRRCIFHIFLIMKLPLWQDFVFSEISNYLLHFRMVLKSVNLITLICENFVSLPIEKRGWKFFFRSFMRFSISNFTLVVPLLLKCFFVVKSNNKFSERFSFFSIAFNFH